MARYHAQRLLPFDAERLFDLVADVERYPDYLPWWIAARVTQRRADGYDADQVIGFGHIRERFHSSTRLDRPRRIEVASRDRAFRAFALLWTFAPAPAGGCVVALDADLEFRSHVIGFLFRRILADGFEHIIAALEGRAHELYGADA